MEGCCGYRAEGRWSWGTEGLNREMLLKVEAVPIGIGLDIHSRLKPSSLSYPVCNYVFPTGSHLNSVVLFISWL